MRSDRPDFSFALLEAEVAKYSPDVPLIDAVGRERWFLALGLAGAAFATIAVLYPTIPARLPLAIGGIVAEAVGLGLAVVLQLKREWKSLRLGKAAFANEMDADHVRYRQLITWLRAYPTTVLRESLGYVRRRGETMKRKLGLLSGGLEKLGILPLLAALFLQARSFNWSGNANRLELAVAACLLILYALSWWSVLTTLRLDTYEAALIDALSNDS